MNAAISKSVIETASMLSALSDDINITRKAADHLIGKLQFHTAILKEMLGSLENMTSQEAASLHRQMEKFAPAVIKIKQVISKKEKDEVTQVILNYINAYTVLHINLDDKVFPVEIPDRTTGDSVDYP